MFPQYSFKHPFKRFLAASLDQAGKLIYPLISAKTPAFDSAEVKRILAIRLDHIGDVVMTRPALKLLADAFPQAELDLLVSEELLPLLASDPFIHHLIPVTHHWFRRDGFYWDHYQDFPKLSAELKHGAYDLGVDFRGDLRNIFLMERAGIPWRLSYPITGGSFFLTHTDEYNRQSHQVDVNVRLLGKLGISGKPERLPFTYSETRKAEWLEKYSFLKETLKKRIIIHMGAGDPSKCWPVNYFREIITKTIKTKTAQVILIGTKNERSEMPVAEYPGQLFDLRGLLPLEDLPVLLDVCDFFLGNDSGPAHIAAAQNIPGLILFSGINDSRVWRPWSDHLEIFERTVDQISGSPLESISPEEVYGKIAAMMTHEKAGKA